jgi:hypothetical protein
MTAIIRKKIVPGWLIIMFVLVLFAVAAPAQVTSALWGVDGSAWDTNGILRDFTNVGYKNGDEPIPDWPVAHSVTNFGAIPNDGIDDSQAFIDAIAACSPSNAVLVPKGVFTILQKITVTNDYVCLRGEDMYESVIFFPKKLGEIYINEAGFDAGSTPIYDFFFNLTGGFGKGIENLTFKCREQRMLGTWEYEGSNPVSYNSGVTDSWLRNVVFLNYGQGLQIQATRSSFINIIFDQFNGRCGTDNATQYTDAYGSLLVRNCSYNLFHNIRIEGYVLQPIDLNEASSHNVYSQYRSGERINRSASYHGSSSHYDLYTDLDKGVSQPKVHESRSDETYWNVHDNYTWTEVTEEVYNSSNSLIFVGYGDSFAAKTNDPTLWYEPADYGLMTPANLYLAQLDYFGKPRPEGFPRSRPSRYEGDVFGVVPDDDIKVDNHWYYRFDLSDTNFPAVAHARLRVHMDTRSVGTPPYTFHAWTVTEDDWSEDTLTSTNKPALVSELDSRYFAHADDDRKLEFDVTEFVRDQLVGGDGVVSLALNITADGYFVAPTLLEAEKGTKPELIIERVADPVPGPPSAPRNIGITPLVGNILLDWEDHPESNVTYTVYRNPYKVIESTVDGEPPTITYGYHQYIDNGLVTSDIADIQSAMNWRPGQMYYGVVYKYRIAAVDDHGYESPRSVEIYAATLNPTNDPPAFAGTIPLSNATVRTAYSESIAGDASDPESDQLYFHIASGPAWLNISSNGVLSGSPGPGDAGTNAVTFQVTAIGGSTQQTATIVVDLPADNPPGAPSAPTGLAATADFGSVSLNWDDNPEADLYGYNVYRSTTQGSGYSLIISNQTDNAAVDSSAVNATTYYYIVTAVDLNENESAASSEVSALPGVDLTLPAAPTGLTATPYSGSVILNWADNSEDDLAGYSIFRSTTSGSYGAAMATDLSSSDYTDTNVVNGTTYYYVVTATDTNSNDSAQSSEVSATPLSSLPDNVLISGDLSVAGNWSRSVLPTDPAKPGVINLNNTGANAGGMPAVSYTDFVITQTGGDVTAAVGGIGWCDFKGSTDYTISGGSLAPAGWGISINDSSVFTISGGAVSVGNRLHNSSTLAVSGGTLTTPNLSTSGSSVFNFSGGTTTTTSDGAFYDGKSSGSYTVNFSGSAVFDTTVFGGANSAGTVKIGAGTGSISADTLVWEASTFDWTTGSAFSFTADAFSSGTTWEDLWNAGKLTVDGGQSGTFAENFSVSGHTLTLAVSLSGYDLWATTWNTELGAATNDMDADGMSNFGEYALGGDPTNAAVHGSSPVFLKSGSGFVYVHPQRSDDATITYTVVASTNLITGVWTNQGVTAIGTNVTGGDIDFVTNDVGTVEKDKFFRLKVQQ